MIFRFLAFISFAFITSASAGKPALELSVDTDISATSELGRIVLSKSRSLENKDNDFSWVSGYSIKFVKCATSQDYYAGAYFGGNNNNNNKDRNGFNGMYQQRLVHFKLCPSNSCGSCDNGADYVIDLNEFVEAVVESKLSAQEYNCEMQREKCEYTCQNANDDQTCEYECYANSGLDYCENQNQNRNGNWQQQFNLQEAVNCNRLEVDKEALQYYMYSSGGKNQYQFYGNNGEMGLFVGPYCSTNGKKIMLGVFMDETCSYPAPENLYNKFGFGKYLPYQTDSLVESGCISCKEPSDYNQQNYNDQQDADQVTEVCERLYEESGKCESNLNIYYPNTYACEFIKSLKASGTRMSRRSMAVPAKVFAGIFAVTTVVFAGVAYFLHEKVKRSGIRLTGDNGGQLA